MAADGMDKKGRNSPDSASEELFDLSRTTENDGRRDGNDPREADPPASSASGSQEIVDLPNIQFGTKIDKIDARMDQEAESERLNDDTNSRSVADQDPASRDSSPLSEGFLGEPGSTAKDGPTDPSAIEGDSGLGRAKTLLRPIGPIVSSRDAVLSKAKATGVDLASEVEAGSSFQTATLAADSNGAPATPTPPSGGAPTATGASFSIAENASTGDPVGTLSASDPDVGDTLTFAIAGGNADDGAFHRAAKVPREEEDVVEITEQTLLARCVEHRVRFGRKAPGPVPPGVRQARVVRPGIDDTRVDGSGERSRSCEDQAHRKQSHPSAALHDFPPRTTVGDSPH